MIRGYYFPMRKNLGAFLERRNRDSRKNSTPQCYGSPEYSTTGAQGALGHPKESQCWNNVSSSHGDLNIEVEREKKTETQDVVRLNKMELLVTFLCLHCRV